MRLLGAGKRMYVLEHASNLQSGWLCSHPTGCCAVLCPAVCRRVMLCHAIQVTVFMALLVLDAKRLAQSRLDCLPCLRVPYRDATGALQSWEKCRKVQQRMTHMWVQYSTAHTAQVNATCGL